MQFKPLFFPYDVYSRHRFVSLLAKDALVILDVGGSLKEISHFLPPHVTVYATDVIGGDIISSGTALPFKTHSVDTVISIDTLEHVPKNLRQKFIAELCRVAKKRIILAAPLGTSNHIRAEKSELKRQKSLGQKPDQYLLEHIQEGLPTLEEFKLLLKPYSNHHLFFSGNFVTAQWLFRLHHSQIRLPIFGRLWYELKKYIFAIINLTLYHLEKEVPFGQNVNRFYLSLEP